MSRKTLIQAKAEVLAAAEEAKAAIAAAEDKKPCGEDPDAVPEKTPEDATDAPDEEKTEDPVAEDEPETPERERLDALEERVGMLERTVEELKASLAGKEAEGEESAQALRDATAAVKSLAARFRDPALAQACSRGDDGKRQESEAPADAPAASPLATYLAFKAGDPAAKAFYKAHEAEIKAALAAR